MSKSVWGFSGRYWTGWVASWASLLGVIVSIPHGPDKSEQLAAKHLAGKIATGTPARAASPAGVTTKNPRL